MAKKKGKQTFLTERGPSVRAFASLGSKKESQGPLAACFDIIEPDSTFGQDSWEKAESSMVTRVVEKALEKAALTAADIDCIFAGDLLNQCIGSTFGLRDVGIPLLGIYGACSTMSEGLLLASLLIDAGTVRRAMALTSSHFCTAERQYRFPLEYGSVRPPSAQWTATAAGAVILEDGTQPPYVRAVTIGTIQDKGVTDQNNMGAAMAPAAASTLAQFFLDTGKTPEEFDIIATGDLGLVGSELLLELLSAQGIDLKSRHNDCGLMIYDRAKQDVHAGGSGCGCSAAVLCSFFLPALREGRMKDLLFMSTGALHSPTAIQQKESIPGIAHLVWLSGKKGGATV
jgi:stage V sporulation protein AD